MEEYTFIKEQSTVVQRTSPDIFCRMSLLGMDRLWHTWYRLQDIDTHSVGCIMADQLRDRYAMSGTRGTGYKSVERLLNEQLPQGHEILWEVHGDYILPYTPAQIFKATEGREFYYTIGTGEDKREELGGTLGSLFAFRCRPFQFKFDDSFSEFRLSQLLKLLEYTKGMPISRHRIYEMTGLSPRQQRYAGLSGDNIQANAVSRPVQDGDCLDKTLLQQHRYQVIDGQLVSLIASAYPIPEKTFTLPDQWQELVEAATPITAYDGTHLDHYDNRRFYYPSQQEADRWRWIRGDYYVYPDPDGKMVLVSCYGNELSARVWLPGQDSLHWQVLTEDSQRPGGDKKLIPPDWLTKSVS